MQIQLNLCHTATCDNHHHGHDNPSILHVSVRAVGAAEKMGNLFARRMYWSMYKPS